RVDRERAPRAMAALADRFVAAAGRLEIGGRELDAALGVASRLRAELPDRADLHAAAARLLDRAGRLGEAATAAREAAALDPSHSALAAELAAAAADPSVTRIAFDPATRSIRTEVRIGGRAVPMLVDTGATLTTVPRRLADSLGLLSPENPVVDVETASGRVRTQQVVL